MAAPAAPTHLVATPASSLRAAPTITTATLPAATVGQVYTGTLSATGGLQPYTWNINAGQLPPGLSLSAFTSSSARVTGIPTTAGSYTFAVLCTDALGQTTQLALTMEHPV